MTIDIRLCKLVILYCLYLPILYNNNSHNGILSFSDIKSLPDSKKKTHHFIDNCFVFKTGKYKDFRCQYLIFLRYTMLTLVFCWLIF